METEYRPPVRVALVDDQHLLREALSSLLDDTGSAEVVCSIRHSDESFESIVNSGAAVVLVGLDAQMCDPIAIVHRMASLHPQVAICALVAGGQPAKVHAALGAGCGGAVSSAATLDTVIAALVAVVSGQAYVDANLGGEALSAQLTGKGLKYQTRCN
ncbi:MAG: response regulator transcription factor [Candidatus Eremiobacteraeota bacterium]|nr:response regulator transcription factor [Candidatus Eremiobacteraeota bacterium]